MPTEMLLLLLASLTQPTPTSSAEHWVSCTMVRAPDGGLIAVDQIAHVYFDSGSASISTEGAEELDRYATYPGPPLDCHVIIAGHADMVGRSEANWTLSRRRADAVAAYLRARGATWPITVRYFGETRPAVATSDGVPKLENRRVEVFVGRP